MSLVQSDRPSDVMREIQRQGKFQLCNIELFKELAIMKLKEPEEGWGTFEWEEWPAGMVTDPLHPIKTCAAIGSLNRPIPFSEGS